MGERGYLRRGNSGRRYFERTSLLRKCLLVKFTAAVYVYILMAAGICMLGMMLPVLTANAKGTKTYAEFTSEYAKPGEPLEVELHEDSVSGDYLYKWTVNGKAIDNDTNTYIPSEEDLETFIEVTAYTEDGKNSYSCKLYCSQLPVMYITTEAQIQNKEDYVAGTLTTKRNEEYMAQEATVYNGDIEIRYRGNSTMGYDKKPYKIKLDKKANMFGFGLNKHWVLLANHLDGALMRNKLAYEMSGILGMPYMQSTDVVLIMNGRYDGIYQFCEQIRVDYKSKGNRVDIYDWEKASEDFADAIAKKEGFDKSAKADLENAMLVDMTWASTHEVYFNGSTYDLDNEEYGIKIPKLTGGFLIEMDSYFDEKSKFETRLQQPLMFKSPEFVYTNADLMKYTSDYMDIFENAIQSYDFSDTWNQNKVSYPQLFDMDALVKFWLVNELFMNEDAMKKSTYMYKNLEGPFYMGPIWDMDWSSASDISSTNFPYEWQTLHFNDDKQKNQWYKYIIQDPYFAIKARELYLEIRETYLQDLISANGIIDANRSYLDRAARANTERWHNSGGFPNGGFDYQVDKLKDFLTKRISWLDNQFATVDSLMSSWNTNRLNNSIAGELDVSQININTASVTVPKEFMEIALTVNGNYAGSEKVKDGKAIISFDDTYVKLGDNTENIVVYCGKDKNNKTYYQYQSFTKDAEPVIPSYLITVTATKGGRAYIESEDGELAEAEVSEGSIVKAIAAPDEGYEFEGWFEDTVSEGQKVSTESDYQFTASEDRKLLAVFREQPKPDPEPDPKPDPDPKPEQKPEPKPESKPEPEPKPKPEAAVAKPVQLKGSSIKEYSLKLTWKKAANAVSYKVYRAEKKNGKYKLLAETKKTGYKDTKVVPKKNYYYKVKAVNKSSEKYSSVTRLKTKSLSTPKIKLESVKKKQVKISWNKIAGAKKYVIYRSEKEKGKYKKVAVTTKISYKDRKTIKSNKTYYYKVRAYHSKTSDGSLSKVKSIIVK